MTADSAFFSLLDLRERSERELEAVQAGIRLGVEHRSGFGFSTGLNYAQLNEVYSNNSSVTNLNTCYDIQYFYIILRRYHPRLWRHSNWNGGRPNAKRFTINTA